MSLLSEIKVPSPVQKVMLPILKERNIKLFIKREDLIHPTVSGNKWCKLKANLEKVVAGKHAGIVTYGGAFSNHIHATSAACQLAKIPCVGIIRGEYDEENPTLQFARKNGMKLEFVSRSDYGLKEESPAIKQLLNLYPDYLLVPEGGGNELSFVGLQELASEISELNDLDLITVSAGTGYTAAGIINYQKRPVLVFSALKSDHLEIEIKEKTDSQLFTYINKYHFGGYGKSTSQLIYFINTFYKDTKIPLDPIYNAKTIFGTLDMIKSGEISPGSSILHVHTGGLQGIKAHNYMALKKKKETIRIKYR